MEHGQLLHIDTAEGERLRSQRPAEDTAEALAGAYHALGDPTRLTLALALRGGRELCVCDLSWIVQRSQNLVSHHMKVLKGRGLVRSRRAGQDDHVPAYSARRCPAGRSLHRARVEAVIGNAVSQLGTALGNALLMAWEVWWALVLGFAISAVVQAWVPRERIECALAGGGARPCGDRAGRGVLVVLLRGDRDREVPVPEGRLGGSALAFQFASTNLVWELGLVLWVLIGWQFTLARVSRRLRDDPADVVVLRLFVPPWVEDRRASTRRAADTGHQHHPAGEAALVAGTADVGRCLVGRCPQLPRRLADALQGDHPRFLLAGLRRRSSATTSSSASS